MGRTHVRRVGLPREVAVDAGADGIPVAVGQRRVLHLRDDETNADTAVVVEPDVAEFLIGAFQRISGFQQVVVA